LNLGKEQILEVSEEGAKTRKGVSEDLLSPTTEEINQGFIWNQNCVYNVPANCVHLVKDAKTNHRILNLQKTKETYNQELRNFWNEIFHVIL
jgi:hypothetical protein